jgi:hypothetical protein
MRQVSPLCAVVDKRGGHVNPLGYARKNEQAHFAPASTIEV